ncbi:TIGR03905 family TSCPD domain-containing protein [Clostridium ganghwense]|uniref:ribonucleoside-diphosphate reductase n=1 Tax=Clostridium ganghwense TaxID=312089 RepID=A0ABT4CNE8_9CLOT|nr:TIGR03905 family TSCPD domain-containing protein [Clostridium ganghwense]MCY6370581.1 TIGR03905 family TSCPD domain-containing protein [Clostridium ganghwense]
MYTFNPKGVCSREINFNLEDNKVKNVSFIGGCDGNLKGLSSLVEGMEAKEVVKRLKGIHCGNKCTSCPDQLSKALEELVVNK